MFIENLRSKKGIIVSDLKAVRRKTDIQVIELIRWQKKNNNMMTNSEKVFVGQGVEGDIGM